MAAAASATQKLSIYALPNETAPDTLPTILCLHCGEEKPITQFAPDRRYRTGRKWHCLDCHPTTPRPQLKWCPLCGEWRPVARFPLTPEAPHAAGKTPRRWYCNMEEAPTEVRTLEREKRKLWRVMAEINACAEEEKRLLSQLSGRGFNAVISDVLHALRRKLSDLWDECRRMKARLEAEASELLIFLFDGSRPATARGRR